MRILFSSIIDVWVNLERSVPLRVKKKANKNKNKQKPKVTLNLSILKISRCCFSETRGNLVFFCDCIIYACSPIVLKNMFISLIYSYFTRAILFPITLYFYCDDWQQLKHWAYRVSLWQNWKLEPNKHDFFVLPTLMVLSKGMWL